MTCMPGPFQGMKGDARRTKDSCHNRIRRLSSVKAIFHHDLKARKEFDKEQRRNSFQK